MSFKITDRYDVKTPFGAGGMGSLYLAQDTTLRKLVAIKVLGANLDSGDLRMRFRREALTLAKLNHPNIVTISDFGEFQAKPYIVMDYVRGETLSEKIKRHEPLTIYEKLKMVRELCAGLAHVHDAGIIHRDIKPANLIIDQHGFLKILDFGIARVFEGDKTLVGAQVTQINMRIGTPGYMSPEQIKGGDLDERSDVFAAGAVFYELLSSRAAFSGGGTHEIEASVLAADPPPLATFVADLDPAVAAVVKQALQKDRDKRFQNASEFEEAVSSLLTRLPVAHTPPPARATPAPTPSPGRGSHRSAAETAYQRSLALERVGAVDAARRFLLEALAEDRHHPGARARLEQLDPDSPLFDPDSPFFLSTVASLAPTMVPPSSGTVVEPPVVPSAAETVVRMSGQRGAPSWQGRLRPAWTRYRWPAAIAGLVLLLVAVVAIIVRMSISSASPALTNTKPTGGTIEPTPVPTPQVSWPLTIRPPKNGTILTIDGIDCGARGTSCSKQYAEGTPVTLDNRPDQGYFFVGYTGACAPDGLTRMTEPRTCGADFARASQGGGVARGGPVAPGPPATVSPQVSPPSEPPTLPPAVESAPPPSLPPAQPPEVRRDPAPREPLPADLGKGLPSVSAPEAPADLDALAQANIKKTLERWCQANEELSVEKIHEVFPSAKPGPIQRQFEGLKSLGYSMTGPLRFKMLDAAAGMARVEVDVKQVSEGKNGGTQTQETIVTMDLSRPGPNVSWRIDTLYAKPKKK